MVPLATNWTQVYFVDVEPFERFQALRTARANTPKRISGCQRWEGETREAEGGEDGGVVLFLMDDGISVEVSGEKEGGGA